MNLGERIYTVTEDHIDTLRNFVALAEMTENSFYFFHSQEGCARAIADGMVSPFDNLMLDSKTETRELYRAGYLKTRRTSANYRMVECYVTELGFNRLANGIETDFDKIVALAGYSRIY